MGFVFCLFLFVRVASCTFNFLPIQISFSISVFIYVAFAGIALWRLIKQSRPRFAGKCIVVENFVIFGCFASKSNQLWKCWFLLYISRSISIFPLFVLSCAAGKCKMNHRIFFHVFVFAATACRIPHATWMVQIEQYFVLTFSASVTLYYCLLSNIACPTHLISLHISPCPCIQMTVPIVVPESCFNASMLEMQYSVSTYTSVNCLS